jgi:hypothetical protein
VAVSFVDQVMAYLANSANRGPFITTIGIATYAGASFARRYGLDGYQIDGVTLGAPNEFRLQVSVQDEIRITGTRERRNERPERQWIDYRVHKQEPIGWVDASFSTLAQIALHAVPGTLVLGPGADIQQEGVDTPPPPMNIRIKFNLPLTTDAFTLTYTLQVYVFVSAQLSPTDDLRRIQLVRHYLEADPKFLVSLDGSTDQCPFLFTQVYPTNAANGETLSQATIVQLFDAADILAAFFTPPAS